MVAKIFNVRICRWKHLDRSSLTRWWWQIAILLCLAFAASGQSFYLQHRRTASRPPAGGGSSCLTSTDAKTGTTAGFVELGGSAYTATPFVAGSSYSVCKAVLRMKKTGTPTYTMTCGIYSHDAGGNAPNVLIGNVSANVDASTLSTSEADVTFAGISASVTSGTTYWIVVFCSSEFNSPNVANWAFISESFTHGEMSSSLGTIGNWSSIDDFSRFKWTLYQ